MTDDLLISSDARPGNQADDNKLADLGVLLVHGIGQSHSGDTLSRFGEPLVKWIVDWVGEVGEAKVEVHDAVLGVEAEDPSVPAHARLQVSGPAQDGSGNKTTQWLVAESWWAESFLTPSFGDIAGWGFKVVPWTAFYHFHRRLMRAGSRFVKARDARPRNLARLFAACFSVVMEFATQLIAFLLAPIGVAILAVLLILGMFPIPSLRRMVARVQRGLALTIGDSYALLGPKIGSAAIYGRVSRELQWMEKRVKRIAVVAHSQGAAVAYRVVSRNQSGKCHLLVTFGAGIRKLTQIRLLDRQEGSWVNWISLALLSLVMAAMISRETLGLWHGLVLTLIVPLGWVLAGIIAAPLLAILRAIRKAVAGKKNVNTLTQQLILGWLVIAATTIAIAIWFPGASRTTTVWVTLLVSFAWGWLVSAYKLAGQAARSIAVMELPESGRAFPATEHPLPDPVRWLDLYAASDPVSNGAIFDDQAVDPVTFSGQSGRLESTLVHNRDSFLLDHTSYWQNSEEFVAEIVSALGTECGLKLSEVQSLDEERLIVARHRRQHKVRWLRRASRFIFASVVAVWAWGDIDKYAIALFDSLLGLVKAVPWLGTLLGSVLPETAAATTSTVAITLALGAFANLGLMNFAWSFWERVDRAALVERRGYWERKTKGLHPALFFHFTWLLAVAVGLGLVFEWMAWPWWAYLISFSCLFLAAGAISGGADTFSYVGDINASWPELLRRNDRWNAQTQAAWQKKMQAGTTGFIDLARTRDGAPVWVASLVLGKLASKPSSPVPYEVFPADSLFIALAWCKTRAARQLAAAGDGVYLAADAVLLGQGNGTSVMQFWSRVINHPGISATQRAEALLNRALRLADSGNIEEAFADYDAVIDLSETTASDRANALFERGNLAQGAGEHGKAVTDYSAIIDMQDAPAELVPLAFNNRAASLQALGDKAAARADYTAVTMMSDIDTGQIANAYANRGWLAHLQGDNDSFYKDTARAIEYDSQNLAIGFNMGLAALMTGEPDKAADLYSQYAKCCEDQAALQAAINDLDTLEQSPAKTGKNSDIRNVLKTRVAELGNA